MYHLCEIYALDLHGYIEGFKKLNSVSTDFRIICVEMESERVYDKTWYDFKRPTSVD